MAASGFEARNGEKKLPASRTSVAIGGEVDEAVPYAPNDGADSDSLKPVYDYTHRRLRSRHIQLIGIGGYVTAALNPPYYV